MSNATTADAPARRDPLPNVRTIDQYLRDEYNAGRIDARQVARELHAAGWTPYVYRDADALGCIGIDPEPPRKDPDEDAPRVTVARVSMDGFAADTDEARDKWRDVFRTIAAARAEADKPRRRRAKRIAQPTLF